MVRDEIMISIPQSIKQLTLVCIVPQSIYADSKQYQYKSMRRVNQQVNNESQMWINRNMKGNTHMPKGYITDNRDTYDTFII
jgi:hypothetical protein